MEREVSLVKDNFMKMAAKIKAMRGKETLLPWHLFAL